MGFSELIEWYVTAELLAIRLEAGRSQRWLGDAIRKHENTISYWERGQRLPDVGNVAHICKKLGAEKERAEFLEHVTEQLHLGPGLVSDLNKRNIFIIEGGERTYGVITKWDPLLIPALLQTEAYHMKQLAEPREGAALKIKHWKRKERRIAVFFGRNDFPRGKFLVPAFAIENLDRLTTDERSAQLQRLCEVAHLPNNEVRVVAEPHEALHAFEIFQPDGRTGAGPAFVYVESIDQSRHIVEPEKLALYDQVLDVLWKGAIPIGRYLDG
ncbi:Scr1 family TA system antitoxin-like transcriptional regulator [Glycomyces tenuis]|uniref:Scr1 family TA system antitoxin-like transcriptional regulator n=1 Tax=Glycomyces tenuis TaxID=58116 RepID=UPI0003FF650C|nr:Scr1 family TA system antitoxin-like transcriptional regulator [Glycomyces tenuis]